MIIHIISSIKGGGAEIIVQELHKIYLNKNLNSYVIYFTGDDTKLSNNETVLNLSHKNPFLIFYLRKVIKKLMKKTKKNIIIHVHLTWPFFYTAFAVLGLKNVKLIFTEHAISNRRRKIPFLKFIERLFYSRYSSIVCISKGVYKSLAKWVGNKIQKRLVTIPNGSRIFTLPKRTSLKKRLPRLISVGSLIYEKNFSTTIKSISKIKDDIENYTIIGEGPERKKLEEMIINLKLKNKVKLIGWSDKIEKYLHNSDIQLLPSLAEGFGLVAVEGMSTGLPIIASNIEGLNEVLGPESSFITLIDQVDSPDEWKKAIYKVINDIHILGNIKISKLAKQQAKKFTFKKMAKSYLEVYYK